jgi:hypothetical protein
VTTQLLEHIEHFESRYKRHYDKYMQAMTDFSIGCLQDEQILKAMAFCECQRLGRYLREDVLTSPNFCNDKLKKARASVVSRIHDFGISDRLPDINDRANRIVNRDLLELLDDLLINE